MDQLQEAVKRTEESLENLDKDIAEAVALDEKGSSVYSGDRKKIPTDSTHKMLQVARDIHETSITELEVQIKGLEWLKENTQTAIDSIDVAIAFIGDHAHENRAID